MNPVAIIGGGITGLTAAFRLRERGVPVTLYESGPRVGGVIQTVRQDGYLAECGPNTLLETSPRIGELIRDAGLEDQLLYSDPGAGKRFLVRRGQPVPLPGSPAAFLFTRLFSLGAKLRLLREPFIRPGDPDADESVAAFVRRRLGQEFLDYAINPLVAGIYAGDPALLSVKHAFPKLHALEQRYRSLIRGQILGARERGRRAEVSKQNARKISFRTGLQALPDALHARLSDVARLSAPVTGLARNEDGWMITVRSGDEEEVTVHPAVVFAAPAYRLAGLKLAGIPQRPLRSVSMIPYPPVASVVLGFRREDVVHPLDGFGMLIPEIERFNILGTLFSSSLFPSRAPEGCVTLSSYVGGTRAPDLALESPDELVRLTLDDLRHLLGVRGEPTFRHTFVFPRAIPQYNVGFGQCKELMDRTEMESPGLFLAGHYREGISLSDSIVSGDNVTKRVCSYLEVGRTGLESESTLATFAA